MIGVEDGWQQWVTPRAQSLLRRRLVLHEMDSAEDDGALWLAAVIGDNCLGNHEVPVRGGGMEVLRRDDFGMGLRCVGVRVEGKSELGIVGHTCKGLNLLDQVADLAQSLRVVVDVETVTAEEFRFVLRAGDALPETEPTP